jgi:NADPH:quinone reductase-like Zn-dependent oxidoreductase
MGGGKTAWGVLFEIAMLKKGQRILIHGTSGGVGLFAVQLAHQVGAHVIVTTAEKNVALLLKLGANEIIDYHKENFEQRSGKVDVLMDGVGGDLLKRSYQVVKRGGILISIVEQPSKELAAQYHIRALWGGSKNVSAMKEVDRRLQEKELQPIVSKIFTTLSQAAIAQDYSKKGEKNMGKIVLGVA